jgi:hypothetical protein
LDLLTANSKTVGGTRFVATFCKSDTKNVKIFLHQNICCFAPTKSKIYFISLYKCNFSFIPRMWGQKFCIYFQVVCFYSRILRPCFLSNCVETGFNGDFQYRQITLGTVSKNWYKVRKILYFAKVINS